MVVAVPVNDLKRQNHSIEGSLQAAISRVLSRGWYVLGPEVEDFEAKFASFVGVEHCIGVGNGTDALELALRALGVGPGDQVATVANAGMYGTVAIWAAGAEPLYVDVDPALMTMDADRLAASLTPGTTAVIVTHLYGQMADMPRLLEVAGQAGVPVVEDCAQAHGARLHGKPAGSWGCIGCFSFYPTKNLGALGDAGALVTGDAALAERTRLLRQYGWAQKYQSSLAGGRNSRLDELQAAVLLAKLPYLEAWNERRRAIARTYTEALQRLGFVVPTNYDANYVAHLYVLRTPYRSQLQGALTASGIGTDVHYPVPDHHQESVRQSSSVSWSLPVTEKCSQEVLTLPCFPELTDAEVQQVIQAVCRARLA